MTRRPRIIAISPSLNLPREKILQKISENGFSNSKEITNILIVRFNNVWKNLQEYDPHQISVTTHYGSYVTKNILKNAVYQTNPDYDPGQLTKAFEKVLAEFKEIIKEVTGCNAYAFIGAYYNSYSDKRSMELLQYLFMKWSIEKPSPHPMEASLKYYYEKKMHEFEVIIGYSFRDKSLLVQAFTAPSHEFASINGNNKRLANLGDALIDQTCHRDVQLSYPWLEMAEIRTIQSDAVSDKTFISLAKEKELGRFGLYLPEVTEKYFADLIEATAGAVFLDSGGKIETLYQTHYNKLLLRRVRKIYKEHGFVKRD